MVRSFRLALTAAWFCLTLAFPAQADPITGFIAGLSYALSGTVALVPFAGATAAGFAVGTFLTSAAGALLLNAALTIGTSLLSNALSGGNRPPAQQAQNPGTRLVNLRQPVQDRTRGYGRYRTGGPVAFWKLDQGRRYVAVMLHTGEITAIEAHYLGERTVTIDGTLHVTEPEYQSDGVSVVQIEGFLGAPGQIAPSLLSANFAEWTSAHKFTGIAGVVCAFANTNPEDFSTAYPDGREPTYTALIAASKVYDPRKDSTNGGSGSHRADDSTTWEWTTNAALIMADWCTHADGLGGEVDWSIVADEADAADVTVLDRNGNSIPKWQLCGAYSLNEPRENVRSAMALACDAFFYETDEGKIAFRVGRWMEPSVTITGEHIYSATIHEGQDGTGLVNAVSAQFLSAANGYREQQTTAFYEDNGEAYHEEEISAFWAPNHNQAVRVCKRVLRTANARFDISLRLKLYGLLLREKRFFRLEWTEMGISAFFEVYGWSFSPDGMHIEVSARQVAQADFAFTAATEEPAPSTISDVTADTDLPTPENAALSSSVSGQLFASFDTAPRGSLVGRMRYREVSTVDWFFASASPGSNYIAVNGLPVGDTYEAEVQFRTAAGKESAWVATSPSSVEIAASSSPPGPVTGASVSPGSGTATFAWTAPDSPNYAGTRIYTNSTNSFAGATLRATEYGLPNAADSRTVTLAAGTYYGFLVAINGSGDAASEVATGSFTVT